MRSPENCARVLSIPINVDKIRRKEEKKAKLWYLDKIIFSECLPGFWTRST